MTKILAYDQTILSKLPHQTLTSLQCFTHAINYGHVDTQEILLTISTHPEHIAPNTIILDEKNLAISLIYLSKLSPCLSVRPTTINTSRCPNLATNATLFNTQ